MTVCGSQKKEWELFTILTLTIYCLCGQSVSVDQRSQSSSQRRVWALRDGVRRGHVSDLQHFAIKHSD